MENRVYSLSPNKKRTIQSLSVDKVKKLWYFQCGRLTKTTAIQVKGSLRGVRCPKVEIFVEISVRAKL